MFLPKLSRFFSASKMESDGGSSSTHTIPALQAGETSSIPQEDQTPKSETSLTPREYQLEMVRLAKAGNVIVKLDTGAGKTFIASMLMQHMLPQTRASLADGGKRIVFLVKTVHLVEQQAKAIRSHTHLDEEVGEYHGQMSPPVDFYSEEKWHTEFEEHRVLVFSARVFLDILNHAKFSITKVCLIVFDECHHARKEDDYAMICQHHLTQYQPCDRPKILGLTASVVNGKVKDLEEDIKSLERLLLSRVVTSCQPEASTFNKKIRLIEFQCGNPDEWCRLLGILETAHEGLKAVVPSRSSRKRAAEDFLAQKRSFAEWLLEDGGPTVEQRSKRAVSDCIQIFNLLGLWCAATTARSGLESLEAAAALTVGKPEAELVREVAVKALSTFLRHVTALGLPKTPTDGWITDRVRQLVRKGLAECFGAAQGAQTHCVLFVDERQTACALTKLLCDLRSIAPALHGHVRAAYVTGHGGHDQAREVAMDTARQSKTLRDFRTGAVNLLVATRVVEEGMDVRKCNAVFKLSCPAEFRSFVQSSGRARLANSRYYVMVPNNAKDSAQQKERLRSFLGLYSSLREKLTTRTIDYNWWSGEIEDQKNKRDIFQPAGRGGALIDRNSAMSVLNRYVGRLRHDCLVQPRAQVFLERQEDGCATGMVMLPMPCPVSSVVGPLCKNARQARAGAALEACRALYKAGELGEDLLPKRLLPEEEEAEEKEEEGVAKVGTQKRTREYPIGLARELSKRQKEALELRGAQLTDMTLALYVLEVNPKPADASRLEEDFGAANISLALLFPAKLNDEDVSNRPVATWPLFFPASTSTADLVFQRCVRLNKEMADLLQNFHSVAMTSLFLAPPVKAALSYFELDLVRSPLPFLCALAGPNGQLAANLMRRAVHHRGEQRMAQLPVELWPGALVLREAEPGSQVAKENALWIVKQVAGHLNPQSPFPDPSKAKTFAAYHSRITGRTIRDERQALIEVVPCPSIPWRLFHRPAEVVTPRRIAHEVHLVPELCRLLPLPAAAWILVAQLPACLVRLNQLLLARWLHSNLFAPLPPHLPLRLRHQAVVADPSVESDVTDLVAAMTTAKVGDFGDLERLETMGDSFLKFAVSVALHAQAEGPRESEGHLTARRTRLVCNATLFRRANARDLWMFVQSEQFGPECLRPPGVEFPSDWTRVMNDKTIADFVEALIGYAYIHFGKQKALSLLDWLGLDLGMQKAADGSFSLPDPRDPVLTQRSERVEQMLDGLCDGLQKVEHILQYRFENRAHLLQAMTHASCLENRITECYQKLEYLGDAVLDFVFTKCIFTENLASSPGDLTDLRSALVSNRTFAMVVVRSGLHRFLKHADPKLMQLIPEFAGLIQEEQLDEQDHCIAQFGSDASGQTVLKILGDIFEAVIGAVYLDSNRNLNTVWRIVRLLMADIIEKYSQNIPKNPIRLLYERCHGFKFGAIEEVRRGVFKLTATYGGRTLSAEGRNKKSCKLDLARAFLWHADQSHSPEQGSSVARTLQ